MNSNAKHKTDLDSIWPLSWGLSLTKVWTLRSNQLKATSHQVTVKTAAQAVF